MLRQPLNGESDHVEHAKLAAKGNRITTVLLGAIAVLLLVIAGALIMLVSQVNAVSKTTVLNPEHAAEALGFAVNNMFSSLDMTSNSLAAFFLTVLHRVEFSKHNATDGASFLQELGCKDIQSCQYEEHPLFSAYDRSMINNLAATAQYYANVIPTTPSNPPPDDGADFLGTANLMNWMGEQLRPETWKPAAGYLRAFLKQLKKQNWIYPGWWYYDWYSCQYAEDPCEPEWRYQMGGDDTANVQRSLDLIITFCDKIIDHHTPQASTEL